MSAAKAYLGDGVYVDHDPLGLRLTTENGIATTNTIILEDAVLIALERYVARMREHQSAVDDAWMARTRGGG